MAVGDIIEMRKRSTVNDIESYTFWHMQEAAGFAAFRTLGASEMDRFNFYDPFGEGGRNAPRTLQVRYRWIEGADAGREEFSNLWIIHSTGQQDNTVGPPSWSPCIELRATDPFGRTLRRMIYPFNPGTLQWYSYSPPNAAATFAFWNTRAQFYKVGFGTLRFFPSIGRFVIWSRKHGTWGLVDYAAFKDFISSQKRRRYNDPH